MTSTGDLSILIGQTLAAQFDRARGKVHALVEPLSTEQLWTRPYPYGNSVGHLLLHLTGNLSYYIGTQIASSGYVRDRPREFDDTSHRPKDEVLAAFDGAVEMVLASLAAQREADWGALYRGAQRPARSSDLKEDVDLGGGAGRRSRRRAGLQSSAMP